MKICPTCKTEYAGGEVFCPVDASRLVTPSQIPGPEERSPNDPLVGTLLAGRYKVLRRIGEFLKELEFTEGRATGIPKIIEAMAK